MSSFKINFMCWIYLNRGFRYYNVIIVIILFFFLLYSWFINYFMKLKPVRCSVCFDCNFLGLSRWTFIDWYRVNCKWAFSHKTEQKKCKNEHSHFRFSCSHKCTKSEVWVKHGVRLWERERGVGEENVWWRVECGVFWCLYSSRATSAIVGWCVGGRGVIRFIQVAWLSFTQISTKIQP